MRFVLLPAVLVATMSASAFAETILSANQSAEIIRQLIVKAGSLQIEVDPRTDADEKVVLAQKNFDLASYLLNVIVNSNMIQSDDSTVYVTGVEGICSDTVEMSCTLKIFKGLYYKEKDGFKDKVGDQVLTIDFKAHAGGKSLLLSQDKIKLLVEF